MWLIFVGASVYSSNSKNPDVAGARSWFSDQKPSRASPTQLNAKRQQAAAATDARVASALTGARFASAFAEDMITFPGSTTIEYCRTTFTQTWRDFVAGKKRVAVAAQQQLTGAGERNPAWKTRNRCPPDGVDSSVSPAGLPHGCRANVRSKTPPEPNICRSVFERSMPWHACRRPDRG
jgi:hypothetical protein